MKSFVILLMLIPCLNLYGQSENFIAQGHYYKAKELYEGRNYRSALTYIANSKSALKGSNYQLQYLHIMSLVKVGDYTSAKKEMETYFEMLDNSSLAKGFTRNVERLTNDETKELSKIMIDIMERSDKQIANLSDRNYISGEINRIFKRVIGRNVGNRDHLNSASFRVVGDQVTVEYVLSSEPKMIQRNYPANEYFVDYYVINFKVSDIASLGVGPSTGASNIFVYLKPNKVANWQIKRYDAPLNNARWGETTNNLRLKEHINNPYNFAFLYVTANDNKEMKYWFDLLLQSK